MDSEVARFIELTDRAAVLLRERGSAHWADWLSLSATELRRGDGHGVTRLLSAYGGMGSVNDSIPTEDLEQLLSELYALAARFARELAARKPS